MTWFSRPYLWQQGTTRLTHTKSYSIIFFDSGIVCHSPRINQWCVLWWSNLHRKSHTNDPIKRLKITKQLFADHFQGLQKAQSPKLPSQIVIESWAHNLDGPEPGTSRIILGDSPAQTVKLTEHPIMPVVTPEKLASLQRQSRDIRNVGDTQDIP